MATDALRVLFVTSHYSPSIGGVETHVRELARHLTSVGWTIEIYTPATQTAPGCETVDGVRVRRFAAHGPRELQVPLGITSAVRSASARFDIMHIHNYHAAPASLAALGWRGPLVLTPHYHGSGHTRLTRAAHVPYQFIGRRLFGRADSVVCVSHAEKTRVNRDFPGASQKTVVIPNGIDVQAIERAVPFRGLPNVVLAVGRLEPYKQVDTTLRSMAHVRPDARLIIIGAGRAERELRRIIAEIGVAPRVEIYSGLSDGEVARWFRTADVFVTMSQHEAFGLTLAESLVAGGSAVASDIPAHREIASMVVNDRVTLIPPDATPVQVARAIESQLAGDKPDGDPRGGIADWSEVGDRLVTLYRRLVDAGRHS